MRASNAPSERSQPYPHKVRVFIAGLLVGSLAVVGTMLFPASPAWNGSKLTRRLNRLVRPRQIARVIPIPVAGRDVSVGAQGHIEERQQPGLVSFTRSKDLVAPHIKAVTAK